MNIQKALDIVASASNSDHLKYFKEQVRHLKKEHTSDLKELLDFIHNDTQTWLRTLPDNAKSKPTFHKYRASIYQLLENSDVIAKFGSEYCSSVTKAIKNCFKNHLDIVVQERSATNTRTISVSSTSQPTQQDKDEETDNSPSETDNESEDDSSDEEDYQKKDVELMTMTTLSQSAISTVSSQDTACEEQDLKKAYNEMFAKYNELNIKYSALQSQHSELQTKYITTNTVMKILENDKKEMWNLIKISFPKNHN